MKRFLAVVGAITAIFTPALVLAYGAGFGSGGTAAGSAANTGGVIFNSNTAPAGTNAYWNYDGTNLVGNVPASKGFSFTVNQVSAATIAAATGLSLGGSWFSSGAGFVAQDASKGPKLVYSTTSTTGGELDSKITDGASAIALAINSQTTLSTAGAKVLSVQNNGTEYLNAAVVAADVTNQNGQVSVSHLAGGSGAPTSPTAGTGCGTSSAANNAGSDLAGTIGVTCGSAGTAGNHMVSITWAHAYNTAPICTIAADNANTATTMVSAKVVPVTSTTQLSIDCGTGGTCPSSGANLWTYVCSQ